MWGKKESLTTTLQVQSSNSPLELEDRAHENLKDPHPSARSLKFRYQNLENRHPSARSWKKYVKEIKGKVEIYGLFYTNILFVSRI